MAESLIIVFGATGGIGSALCRLLRPSHQLLLCARGEERLRQLGEELDSPWTVADATSFSGVEAAFEKAASLEVRLVGAVHCVGSIVLKPVHLTTEAEFDETIAVNLKSAFALCRSAAKAMSREGGSVVLFSSAAGRVGLPNHEAIAAAKAGVEGLVRSAAASYAAKGLRFNAVAPGLVDTPLASRITSNPKSLQASEAMHPMGRIGNAQEVAEVAAWLLDPRQSFVTGQVIGVDGGLATLRGR